ncbi:MAG: beta-N-acetylhexosaminidase [Verrucomicrobiae bacterium]
MTPSLPLIPQPAETHVQPGRLAVDESLTITCLDPEFFPEAGLLAERLRAATGFPVPVETSDRESGRIVIRRESCGEAEAYRLDTDAQGCSLCAGTRAGIFRGIQTLLQLFPPAVFSRSPRERITWELPFVSIADRPRFAWRGAMLDVSRHFATVEFLHRFLDAMAMHKLNVFHWHLTDDQGWRIEIKKYPRLTEVGSCRRETLFGHYNAAKGGDGIPHSGFYTQEDIRDVVEYAAARHIEVVPEIDMPGHMTAAIAAYPELGCTGSPIEVGTKWGVIEDILQPSEEAIGFCLDVLAEVVGLFPSKFIHLGGDEAVKTQWKNSPAIQEMIRKAGAANEEEMQGYFLSRMNQFLIRSGRRMIGWDEILEGATPEGAAVMSWRGEAGGVAAVRAGRDVIMAPNHSTYLDHYQSPNMEDEPLAIGGMVSLEKCYGYDPIAKELGREEVDRILAHGKAHRIQAGPVELSPEEKARILGLQGQLWREYLPGPENVEYMAFPRLCALAEVGWSRPEKDFPDFLARLKAHLKRLDVMGVRYRALDQKI